eukprot:11996462-Ditylum_brightwellii.AAC.1
MPHALCVMQLVPHIDSDIPRYIGTSVVQQMRRSEDWQKWKTRMQCAFNGSGYKRILSDQDYAMQHPAMSCI